MGLIFFKDEEKRQASFTEQLITKIIDNLQVRVCNIHIRYEDAHAHPAVFYCFGYSCVQNRMALGITLKELSAVSTDANWMETFIQEARTCIYKVHTHSLHLLY
jgi:vacuolar protein sorting-associated protein 13A/C